jgi:cytidine deaminase
MLRQENTNNFFDGYEDLEGVKFAEKGFITAGANTDALLKCMKENIVDIVRARDKALEAQQNAKATKSGIEVGACCVSNTGNDYVGYNRELKRTHKFLDKLCAEQDGSQQFRQAKKEGREDSHAYIKTICIVGENRSKTALELKHDGDDFTKNENLYVLDTLRNINPCNSCLDLLEDDTMLMKLTTEKGDIRYVKNLYATLIYTFNSNGEMTGATTLGHLIKKAAEIKKRHHHFKSE